MVPPTVQTLHFLLASSSYLLSFWLDILTSVKWYFVLFLTCISLMISDNEHLFIYLLTIYIFFGKICIQVLSLIFNHTVWILAIELYEFLIYFWILTPYQICGLQIFYFLGCLFILCLPLLYRSFLVWCNPI